MTSNNSKCSRSTFFISDLHLDPSRPQLFTLFYDFIDSIRDQADALYILGDLFEFWIGDDIIDLPEGVPYLPVIEKLKSLSDAGVTLYFIQGNRDFLAQDEFVKRIGAELLPDYKVIDLYGTPTMIMHGDTLCTDDKGYQRMRRIFHNKIIQKLYLALSPASRNRKANKIRNKSKRMTQQKDENILDVNPREVEKMCKTGGVCLLIHGHTHRPAVHELELAGKQLKRVVLGDWHDKACYLRVNKTDFEFIY